MSINILNNTKIGLCYLLQYFAYFITFNENFPKGGQEIQTNQRLPIKRKEVDNAGIYVLDPNDNTIQFNKTGAFKVHFIVNSYVYVTYTNEAFDSTPDFVSLGFRKVDDV